MKDYTKERRRRLLGEILRRQGAGSQVHLLWELRSKGVSVTQATISRDLHDMGYVRVRAQPGVYRYEKLETSRGGELWRRLRVLFENFVTDIKGVGNLLVIKTSPGNANGGASLIDGLRRPGILGTVAGDDTILLITDSDQVRASVEEEFQALL
jgi:transcriptional regulator of arginine metabolism